MNENGQSLQPRPPNYQNIPLPNTKCLDFQRNYSHKGTDAFMKTVPNGFLHINYTKLVIQLSCFKMVTDLIPLPYW